MTKQPGLTPAQRSAFFRALSAASIELGLDTAEDRETYRKTVMREETGKEHLAQLSRTKDFDACMRRFAADAGNFEETARFAIADDARKAAILRICCAQVLQLKGCVAGTTEAADYLAHSKRYKDAFKDVDPNTVHRGFLEELLHKESFNTYFCHRFRNCYTH